MTRFFLIVLVLGLIVVGVGVVVLGTFPPNPAQHQIEKVLPNDKFQTN
jgi:hypothetical protein